MHIAGSTCFDPLLDDIVLSGTNTGGALALTSTALNSQVVTVTATGSGNTLNGTYSIAGGCGAGDKGTLAGVSVPSLSGTWKSNILSVPGTNVTLTANLTQATVADTHGIFLLSGTYTLSGAQCSTGGNIISVLYTGVWGNNVAVRATTADLGGGQGMAGWTGIISDPSNARTIGGSYYVTQGVCAGTGSTLLLTRQ
jgi:hypothetical protein